MPKKKAVPQEEPEQTAAEPLEQDGTELHAPPEELPMDGAAPDGPPPPEMGKFYEAPPTPTDASGLPVESEVDTPEVVAVDASDPLVVQRFEQSKQQMYGKILSKW